MIKKIAMMVMVMVLSVGFTSTVFAGKDYPYNKYII